VNVTEVWPCDSTELGDTGTNPDIEFGPKKSPLVPNCLPVNNSPPVLPPNKPVSNEDVSSSSLDDVLTVLVPDVVVTPTTKTKSVAVSTKKMVDECKCETTVPLMPVVLMMLEVLVTMLGMVTGITRLLTNVSPVLFHQLLLVKEFIFVNQNYCNVR
jgi:hypothetical protein